MWRRTRGLALACHPLPSLAVTGFAVAFGVVAGLSVGRLALLALAGLTGQLSVGWLNDLVDADLDRRAGRRDKPIASGAVSVADVRVAAGAAAVVCVAASLSLGLRPGLLHLVAVGSAYAYDVRLKWTVLSWLPFAVSFALMPCVVTTSLAAQPFPAWGIIAAGGSLGVGAHFANTVKDTEADALTGVRGLPQRMGPRWSLCIAASSVLAAGAAVVLAVPRGPAFAFALVATVAALAAALLAARGQVRLAFPGLMLAAGLVVVGVVVSGTSVTG